jgi:NAD(P)-dependent dehydrogenase (short-subunit alcohol dehydrogenase family)
MYNLTGKVAVVTGAGGKYGFGRAIARRLAEEGCDLVIVDKLRKPARVEDSDADWKGIDSVAEEVKAAGRKSWAVVCDISQSSEVDQLVKETVSRFSKIDILVNNAGVKINQDVLEITDEIWNLHLAVNLTGMFYCSRAVAREMAGTGKGGKIINIGSMWGKTGARGQDLPYSVSKFGVTGLTQGLALQLAQYKILVNAICPALTDTGINSEVFVNESRKEGISWEAARAKMYAKVAPSIPLGRMGAPDDIANMVAFLASDESNFITGQSFNVNGGTLVSL